MELSAVNGLIITLAMYLCYKKHCDRMHTAYSQQSARSLVDHLAMCYLNTFTAKFTTHVVF